MIDEKASSEAASCEEEEAASPPERAAAAGETALVRTPRHSDADGGRGAARAASDDAAQPGSGTTARDSAVDDAARPGAASAGVSTGDAAHGTRLLKTRPTSCDEG